MQSRLFHILACVLLPAAALSMPNEARTPAEEECWQQLIAGDFRLEKPAEILQAIRNKANARALWLFWHPEAAPPFPQPDPHQIKMFADRMEHQTRGWAGWSSQEQQARLIAAAMNADLACANWDMRKLESVNGRLHRERAFGLLKEALLRARKLRRLKYDSRTHSLAESTIYQIAETLLAWHGTETKRVKEQVFLKGEITALKIVGVKGGNSFQDASWQFGQLNPPYSLVFLPRRMLDGITAQIMHGPNFIYLSDTDLLEGISPSQIAAGRRTIKAHNEISDSLSYLNVTFKLGKGKESHWGMANLANAAISQRDLAEQMTTDMDEFRHDSKKFVDMLAGGMEECDKFSTFSLVAATEIQWAMAELQTELNSASPRLRVYRMHDRIPSLSIDFVDKGHARKMNLWIREDSVHITTGLSLTMVVPLNGGDLTTAVNALRDSMEDLTPMKQRGLLQNEAALTWEVLYALKRQAECAELYAEHLERELNRVGAVNNQFAANPTPEGLLAIREAMMNINIPRLSNSTMRSIVRADLNAQESEATTPSKVSTDAAIDGPPPLPHRASELNEANENARRVLIEAVAMQSIIRWATERHWRWKDRRMDHVGYDLELLSPAGDITYYIELKARSGNEDTVTLTKNELLFASRNTEYAALAVANVAPDGNVTFSIHQLRIPASSIHPSEKGRTYSISELRKTIPPLNID